MDNGTYTDSERNYLSSLGIYGAKQKPDVLLTSGRLIGNCLVEYCLAAPNGSLPAFIQTALGPYGQNDQDHSSLAYGLGPNDRHDSRVDDLEFPSTYNSVVASIVMQLVFAYIFTAYSVFAYCNKLF
ncbi:hypothetical protein IFR05_015781, partial [Cadophora sp. M221]